MKIEKIKADYLRNDIVPPKQMFRVNVGGGRHYYLYDENGEPVFYISVTTLLKKTMPTSIHLIKWMMQRGDAAWKDLIVSAHYGTMLHIVCTNITINGTYNSVNVRKEIDKYIKKESLPESYYDFLEGENNHGINPDNLSIMSDAASWIRFCRDVNLRVVASEIILSHPDGYAGALDVVGYVEIEKTDYWGDVYKSGDKKGEPKMTKKRVSALAIIDIKSGRKGFYESHEAQLHLYRKMWNHNYPNMKVEWLFNWSPKNWKKTPSYNLKDQTGSPEETNLSHYVSIAKNKSGDVGKSIIKTYNNNVVVDGDQQFVNVVSLKEYLTTSEIDV